MTALVWAANVLGWPVIDVTIGFAALRVPPQAFARDTWLTASRLWEQDGNMYWVWLAIPKRKSLLPDGAPWLGGFAKKQFLSRNPISITQFLIEMAHSCRLACLPVCFLWNPLSARWVMAAYSLTASLLCIVAQRINRFILRRITRFGCRTTVRL